MKTLRSIALLPFLFGSLASAQEEPLDPKIQARRTPIVEVIERVKPAVVSITSSVKVQTRLGPVEQKQSGTGVVIWEDGYIITNYHVVRDNPISIIVRFDQEDDSRAYPAKLLSRDEAEDLALLKIDSDKPFQIIPMCEDAPMLGEDVIAIGNALGQSHTVSRGIVSGLGRQLSVRNLVFDDLLQTDAAINHGNSGGPLIDINGELVGINTAIIEDAQSVGYAIPVARVRNVLFNNLLASDQARAYLGYQIDEDNFNITDVFGHGPADLAGIRVGDQVIGINGKSVDSKKGYGLLAVSILPREPVTLRVLRKGKKLDLKLQPTSMVEGMVHRRMGIKTKLVVLNRRYHLQITDVDPLGPASRIKLQKGDVISAVRPQKTGPLRINKSSKLAMLLQRQPDEATLEIEVYRDNNKDGSLDLREEKWAGTVILR
jgi:serine protease Do